jgi:hypothetical protein
MGYDEGLEVGDVEGVENVEDVGGWRQAQKPAPASNHQLLQLPTSNYRRQTINLKVQA